MITYTYDECNRLTLQKVVDRNGTIIAQYQYILGKGGERTQVTESGACGSLETAYDYDDAGRLIKETIQKGEETTTYKYDYDDVGNRIEKRENGVFTTYTYNSRNQLVTEETEAGVVTYSYDANGNLLNQSGAGKAVTYTYDAEGVRRSKVNGEDAIYYVSDTTGSLSYTLAETDKNGNVIATYNRADVLISQVRGEETSYYLFDGHGDVRALNNIAGRITDKYRYNAYGELVERSGETENHYLYTGEYYDGTSNLYYLRARYMNPSTGTFISMDTYEGSIYDPDTLHKYLYANGNPVKYSDPTGNFSAVTMAAGMAINDCVTSAYNVHLMGILSGLSNMAVNSILGEQGIGLVSDFFEGYQSGVWTAGILYLTAAISVKAFAIVAFGTAAMETIASLVLLISAIVEKDTKEILVYGTLVILSIINLYQSYNIAGEIFVSGNKGSAAIEIESGNDSGNYVYRALNQKDYERYTNGLGLEAKNPNGNWDLKEHLVDGSGKLSWVNDPYISTTSDLSVAKGFNQSGSGYGIVKIDLNKVNSPSYKGYEIYPRVNGKEGLPYHYSVWQQEISVYQSIPFEAIVDYFN